MIRNLYNTWEEYIHIKYKHKIAEECKNFVLLKSGSMVYDYNRFDSYLDAMIDAIKNGEDIDIVVSLVFREKIDQSIIKEKLLKIIKY